MTVTRTWAVALSGLQGAVVEVEADLSSQLPDFRIIGLADKALGEAVQRIRNAAGNSGLPLPRRRITVNLSPASLPKQGAGFDVAIAVAALAAEGGLDAASLARTVHIGELGLDGRLRPVSGVLPAVLAAARAGITHAVVPWANRREAELVEGVTVTGAVTLADVARLHGTHPDGPDPADACGTGTESVAPGSAARDSAGLDSAAPDSAALDSTAPDSAALDSAALDSAAQQDGAPPPDLADVIGQPDAVDALVAAAAGGHHLLMMGPPGAGKTMLARRLPGILPELDDEAALTVASIRSLCGIAVTHLDRTPPFEAPHHTASVAALVGGGSRVVRPGAVARASEGVLFLDEAGEHRSATLDALRQPMETGSIVIHRAGFTARFPARFQLVLAANPCPCGNYGVRGATCTCPPMAIRRHVGRLSGPLRDRIDIELAMARVRVAVPSDLHPALTTAAARERVRAARDRAARRLRDTPWRTNAAVAGGWLRQGPSAPSPAVRAPLDTALRRGALTLRGYDRVLRLAWSLADLDASASLRAQDIGRALYLKKGVSS